MAANSEAQQILEQLAQSRHEAAMWSTPQFQPTQTPPQLGGGLTGSADHPGGINLAAIQQQQALEIQNATLQQTYLRAYAQGVPGVMSPIQGMSNPMAANYQLQNMYMMNPYMANFLGQSQGGIGGGMNLAPASMMTAPSMGLFRNGRPGQQGGATGYGGWLRDIATVNDWRSFAPYEDAIDENIAATRRIVRRKENLAIGGLTGVTAIASFAMGGPLGLAAGLVAEPALDLVTSSYYQRRAETEQIYDISKRIATGGNATGFRHQGFSLQESNQLMKGFRKEASESPFYNMQDYMQVLDTGSQMGLYNFAGNSRNTESKTKEIIGMVDVFMRIAGDPDVQSAMQRMGNLQTMGLSQGQMKGALTNIRASANLANTSVDAIMATSGAYGAQMAVSMGGPANFGLGVGAHAQALAEGIAQRGIYNPLELSMRGGKEGITQSLTQAMTNGIYSELGTNVAAFTRRSANGGFEIDREAFDAWKTTGVAPGGAKSLIDATLKNLGTFGGSMPQFIAAQKDLAGQLTSGMSNLEHLMAVNHQISAYRNTNPGVISEDMAWQHFYGDNWKAMKESAGAEGINYEMTQLQEVEKSTARNARNKYVRSQNIFNRIGVGVSSLWESTMDAILPLNWMAEHEQRATMEAAGTVFMPGLNYGFATSSKTTNLEKAGYGRSPGPTQFNYNSAFEHLKNNNQFIKYLRDTKGESAVGEAAGLSLMGAVAQRDPAIQTMKELETFSAIANTTPSLENISGLDDIIKKVYKGEGTDTALNLSAFNSLKYSSSTKSKILQEAARFDSRFALANDKAIDAGKLVNADSAFTHADNQAALLKKVEDHGGVNTKQAGLIQDFSESLLGMLPSTVKRGTANVLETMLLKSGAVENPEGVTPETSGSGQSYDAIFKKFGVTTTPEQRAALFSKKTEIYNAATDREAFTKYTENQGAQFSEDLTSIKAASVEGKQALNDMSTVERLAAPSAFASKSQVGKYAEARTEAMLARNFANLKAEGKIKDGMTQKDYYEKDAEGKKEKSVLANESRQFAENSKSITQHNISSNPGLDVATNQRRSAAALEAIQNMLGEALQRGLIKQLQA